MLTGGVGTWGIVTERDTRRSHAHITRGARTKREGGRPGGAMMCSWVWQHGTCGQERWLSLPREMPPPQLPAPTRAATQLASTTMLSMHVQPWQVCTFPAGFCTQGRGGAVFELVGFSRSCRRT